MNFGCCSLTRKRWCRAWHHPWWCPENCMKVSLKSLSFSPSGDATSALAGRKHLAVRTEASGCAVQDKAKQGGPEVKQQQQQQLQWKQPRLILTLLSKSEVLFWLGPTLASPESNQRSRTYNPLSPRWSSSVWVQIWALFKVLSQFARSDFSPL